MRKRWTEGSLLLGQCDDHDFQSKAFTLALNWLPSIELKVLESLWACLWVGGVGAIRRELS